MQDDARPVGRARRAADEADHPHAARRRRDRGGDQGRARRPVRRRASSPSRRSRASTCSPGSSRSALLGAGAVGVGARRLGLEPARAASDGRRARRRSTPSSSGGSTTSSTGSTSERRRDPGRAARGVRLVPRAVRAAARPRLPLGGLGGRGRGARAAGDGPARRRLEHPVRPRLHRGLRRARRRAPRSLGGAALPRPVPARAGLGLRARRLRARVHGPPALAGAARRRRARPGRPLARLAGPARRRVRVCAAPCIGPVLAAILVLAGSSETALEGAVLLAVYSLGLAIPFVLVGPPSRAMMGAFRWLRDHYRAIQFAGGARDGRARPAALLREASTCCGSTSTARSSGSASSRSSASLDPHRQQVEQALATRAEAASTWPRTRATSTPRCAGAYGPRRRVAFSSWRDAPGWLPFAAWCQATVTWTRPWRKSRSAAGASRHSSSSASCASNQRSARISSNPRARDSHVRPSVVEPRPWRRSCSSGSTSCSARSSKGSSRAIGSSRATAPTRPIS